MATAHPVVMQEMAQRLDETGTLKLLSCSSLYIDYTCSIMFYLQAYGIIWHHMDQGPFLRDQPHDIKSTSSHGEGLTAPRPRVGPTDEEHGDWEVTIVEVAEVDLHDFDRETSTFHFNLGLVCILVAPNSIDANP